MGEISSQLAIENKGTYLRITLPVYDTRSQAESYFAAMYDAVDKYNCRKLLVDFRATRKKIPVIELYELCLYFVSKFGPVHPKIAVVASPEAVYPDRFAENVVRNRGLDLIRFVDDEQEALGWLLKNNRVLQ